MHSRRTFLSVNPRPNGKAACSAGRNANADSKPSNPRPRASNRLSRPSTWLAGVDGRSKAHPAKLAPEALKLARSGKAKGRIGEALRNGERLNA